MIAIVANIKMNAMRIKSMVNQNSSIFEINQALNQNAIGDLYEALRYALEALQTDDDRIKTFVIPLAIDAIARAEGRIR